MAARGRTRCVPRRLLLIGAIVAGALILATLSEEACAQQGPPRPPAYTPIVRNFISGTILDVEGVVSYDRRYVNLNVRAQSNRLIAFTAYYVYATSSSGAPVVQPVTVYVTLP